MDTPVSGAESKRVMYARVASCHFRPLSCGPKSPGRPATRRRESPRGPRDVRHGASEWRHRDRRDRSRARAARWWPRVSAPAGELLVAGSGIRTHTAFQPGDFKAGRKGRRINKLLIRCPFSFPSVTGSDRGFRELWTPRWTPAPPGATSDGDSFSCGTSLLRCRRTRSGLR